MASELGNYRALGDENGDHATFTSLSLNGKTPVPSIISIDDTFSPSTKDHESPSNNSQEATSILREDTAAPFHPKEEILGWPKRPRKAKRTSKHYTTIVADVVAILSSLPFLALALAAIHYTGLEVSDQVWKSYQNNSRIVREIPSNMLKMKNAI
jgi:hypothetical protein